MPPTAWSWSATHSSSSSPSPGSHPDGAAVSVLEHMLGGRPTIAADRGVLLDQSYRLHPCPCAFTSEQYPEGRLLPR